VAELGSHSSPCTTRSGVRLTYGHVLEHYFSPSGLQFCQQLDTFFLCDHAPDGDNVVRMLMISLIDPRAWGESDQYWRLIRVHSSSLRPSGRFGRPPVTMCGARLSVVTSWKGSQPVNTCDTFQGSMVWKTARQQLYTSTTTCANEKRSEDLVLGMVWFRINSGASHRIRLDRCLRPSSIEVRESSRLAMPKSAIIADSPSSNIIFD